MKRLLSVAALLLALLATACSGGTSATNTPAPREATDFDPNLLSTVVLRPDDLPPVFPSYETAFNPAGATSLSFSSFFRGDGITLNSTIVQYADTKARDAGLGHLRDSLAKLVGPEATFPLRGADTAFEYQATTPPGLASLVVHGRYVASVIIHADNGAPAASDRSILERYSGLMIERLQTLLADPSAVTPAVGAQTYTVPSTAVAEPSATPSP